MTWVAVATGGAVAASGYMSSRSQADSASEASQIQGAAAQSGIDEQRRQFNEMRDLLSPYVEAGNTALTQQLALMGLGGDEAQKLAIGRIEQSPEFQALQRQGEEGILQNASATGGLRGGDTQGALAQFRPALLNQQINQQYDRLGGVINQGQASAAGVGSAGLQTGANVANLLGQQGAAQAGASIAQGAANPYGAIAQGLGAGAGIYSKF